MTTSPLTSCLQNIAIQVAVSELNVESHHLDQLRDLSAFPDEQALHPVAQVMYLLLEKIDRLRKQGRIISAEAAASLTEREVAATPSSLSNALKEEVRPAQVKVSSSPAVVISSQATSDSLSSHTPLQPANETIPVCHNAPIVIQNASATVEGSKERRSKYAYDSSTVSKKKHVKDWARESDDDLDENSQHSQEKEAPDDPSMTPRKRSILSTPMSKTLLERRKLRIRMKDAPAEKNTILRPRMASTKYTAYSPTISRSPTKSHSGRKTHYKFMVEQCPFCPIRYPGGFSACTLSRHVTVTHRDIPGTFFECSECPDIRSRNFYVIASIHVKQSNCGGSTVFKYNDHNTARRENAINKESRSVADTPSNQESRSVAATPSNPERKDNATEVNQQRESAPVARKFACPFCYGKFLGLAKLSRHLNESHENIPGNFFRCSNCPNFRRRKCRSISAHCSKGKCGGCAVFDNRRCKEKSSAPGVCKEKSSAPGASVRLRVAEAVNCPWCPIVFKAESAVINVYEHFRKMHCSVPGTLFTCSLCPEFKRRSYVGFADHAKAGHSQIVSYQWMDYRDAKAASFSDQMNTATGGRSREGGSHIQSLLTVQQKIPNQRKKEYKNVPSLEDDGMDDSDDDSSSGRTVAYISSDDSDDSIYDDGYMGWKPTVKEEPMEAEVEEERQNTTTPSTPPFSILNILSDQPGPSVAPQVDTRKTNSCPVCNREWTVAVDLVTILEHIRTEHSNMRGVLRCSQCPATSDELNDIQQHQQMCTGQIVLEIVTKFSYSKTAPSHNGQVDRTPDLENALGVPSCMSL